MPKYSHVLMHPEEAPYPFRPACVYAIPEEPSRDHTPSIYIVLPVGARVAAEQFFRGRVRAAMFIADRDGSTFSTLAVDAAASRFTGESVAGLVVAAMGTFVFTLYLRKWLRERADRGNTDSGQPLGRVVP
ncbi:MAG: hypothetical protein ACYS9X_20630 [Planctomycetota bacterium]|jgi:hypothetical protein